MFAAQQPSIAFSRAALPESLNAALVHIFSQDIEGVMLVGGTALSGFYAGHRRSDDLDLFVRDDVSFKATLLAVQSLQDIGADIKQNAHSGQYYNALCELDGHVFTIDIVFDANIFAVGHAIVLDNQIAVVDLPTLFKMKSAALLSRCSEKDLYDLIWLCDACEAIDIAFIIQEGMQIDAGMDPETLLFSISTAQLREEACGFAEEQEQSSKDVFKKIVAFQKILMKQLNDFLKKLPDEDLKKIVARLRRL
jgi:predicted nucleotidyltransferase component of viral defense system